MIEIKNQLKLLPQLLLTPQLKLLLKILPMNVIELKEYILEEVQSNPFLEMEFKDLSGGSAELFRGLRGKIDYEDDVGWDSAWSKYRFDEEEPGEEASLLERTVRAEETLSDYLGWQLSLKDVTELDKLIAHYLIGNLDERGYLRVPPGEIARELELSVERVERVREILKTLDPVGVASLSVKECLLTQLEVLGYDEVSLPYRIVKDHLEEIPKGVGWLSKALRIEEEEIKEALTVIKGLEPYPARNFQSTKGLYILPELKFYKEDEEWIVEVLRDNNYKLSLNRYYEKLIKIKGKGLPKTTKDFLRDKMKSAENLLKALDYRYSTLYKVGQAILKHQKNFFEKGTPHLKPLTLKTLAEETGLHESTISRVISQKYADTPQGILPLKSLLSFGYRMESGEDISAKAIMNYLKELIEKEDTNKPYSDSVLAKEIQRKLGVKIARRTVTKYREILGIPSIRDRKKKSKS